jgi:hypothetical protein
MRLKGINDASMLEIMAINYRAARVISKEFKTTALQHPILLLLGSVSIQSKSDMCGALSVPELVKLLSYDKSNAQRVYYAVHEMCKGQNSLLQKQKQGRITYFSLTAKGFNLIRQTILLAKSYRFEVTQIAA